MVGPNGFELEAFLRVSAKREPAAEILSGVKDLATKLAVG